MMNSTSALNDNYEPRTVKIKEDYPSDNQGRREVPVPTYDIYGRKSVVKYKKLDEEEYKRWKKEKRYGKNNNSRV